MCNEMGNNRIVARCCHRNACCRTSFFYWMLAEEQIRLASDRTKMVAASYFDIENGYDSWLQLLSFSGAVTYNRVRLGGRRSGQTSGHLFAQFAQAFAQGLSGVQHSRRIAGHAITITTAAATLRRCHLPFGICQPTRPQCNWIRRQTRAWMARGYY